MNKIILRLFGLEVLALEFGEEEPEDDDPRELSDPAGTTAGDYSVAGLAQERVWGGGDDVRPRPPDVRAGAVQRLGFH